MEALSAASAPEPEHGFSLIRTDEEIRFIRKLAARMKLRAQDATILRQRLDRLERRASETKLSFAVVGEFNTGKSTFINALLRMRLLKSAHDVTTAASTVLSFGPALAVSVTFKDGATILATEQDFGALEERVRRLTTLSAESGGLHRLITAVTADHAVASQVLKAEITVPSDNLRPDFDIIDTPGIGARGEDGLLHENAANAALTELADAVVVLIPGDNVLNRSLLEFLGSSAQPFLHRCIFVLTKMDHIEDAEERQELQEYVETRLARVIGAVPLVLQCAAETMLPFESLPPEVSERWHYWKARFLEMEREILARMDRQRKLIISETLVSVLKQLLSALEQVVDNKRKELIDQRASLEENSVSALQPVLSQLRDRCREAIQEELDSAREKVRSAAVRFETAVKMDMAGIINNASKFSLESRVKNQAPRVFETHMAAFRVSVQATLDALRRREAEVADVFVEEFERRYRDLAALGFEVDESSSTALQVVEENGERFKSARQMSAAHGQLAQWSGEAVGSAGRWVGRMIAGEEGAAAGELVGNIAGFAALWFGVDIQWLRERVRGEIWREIGREVERLRADANADIEAAAQNALTGVDQACEDHLATYTETVNEMLRRYERTSARLAKREAQMEADAAELRRRSEYISLVRDHLAGRAASASDAGGAR